MDSCLAVLLRLLLLLLRRNQQVHASDSGWQKKRKKQIYSMSMVIFIAVTVPTVTPTRVFKSEHQDFVE